MVLEPLLSDQEFEDLCAANSDIKFERTKEGVIVVNAPAGYGTGKGNAEIIYQLKAWLRKHRRGDVIDSSTGIFLPDSSSLSPDAAYITAEQAATLTSEDEKHFLSFVPAFVLELRSETDNLFDLKTKMEKWIANGAQLAWLVDPKSRSVHVYEAGKKPRIETGDTVSGAGPVEGFILDLNEVLSNYQK